MKKGERHPTGVIARMKQFFADNPGEELSFEDVAAKYDITLGSAYKLVREARIAGELEVVRVVRGRQMNETTTTNITN